MTIDSVLGSVINVVDDDGGVRNSLRRLLESHGFAVRDHASGNDFLDGMQVPKIGCLVLDFQLPGLTGLETLTRAQSQGWTLPVIIITGCHDESVEEKVLRAGAWAFLSKPIDPFVLCSIIDRAVRGQSKAL